MTKVELLARLLRAEIRALIADNKAELRIHPGAEQCVIDHLIRAGVALTDAGDLSFAATERPNLAPLQFIGGVIRERAPYLFI